jgi:transcriptional regulator with XRE-family HTH domain
MEVTAAEVRAARLALGMTQEQLAVALGFGPHRSRISEIEGGRKPLSKSKALLLEMMLNGPRPHLH